MIDGKAALLVIDVQHDFVDDDAPVSCAGGVEMLPRVQALIDACRRAGVPVVYTQEVHRPGRVDMGRELDGDEPDHCVIGSPGVDIVDDVAPQPGEAVVRKARYDAFLNTDLELVLNGLGVLPHETLILCGLATNVCVHYTGAGAHQRDYRIKVVRDCCAGSSTEAHDAALAQLDYLQHGAVVTLAELLVELAQHWPEQRQ